MKRVYLLACPYRVDGRSRAAVNQEVFRLTTKRADPRLKGVIFDMDGVLVLSEPIIAAAAIRMFAEKGFEVRREEFRPFIGMGEDRFIGGVAEARGIPLDPEKDKAKTYALYLEMIRGNLTPLPGVVDFVAGCKRLRFKIAVASSADEIKAVANLNEIGLPPEGFDAVVSGSQVARKKPAPDIFLEAARRLGLDPRDCLVVEDAISGVNAAKSAGARCLAVTTSFDRQQLAAADWIVDSLAEVPAEVLGW